MEFTGIGVKTLILEYARLTRVDEFHPSRVREHADQRLTECERRMSPELDLMEVLYSESEPLWYAAVQLGSVETARHTVASLLKHGQVDLLSDGEATKHWQWREILGDDASWQPVKPKESSHLWLRLTDAGIKYYAGDA